VLQRKKQNEMLCGPALHSAFAAREVSALPFRRSQAGYQSYDICLGSFAYYPKDDGGKGEPFVMGRKPHDVSNGAHLWEPFGARLVKDLTNEANRRACQKSGLTGQDQVMIIQPGKTILASSKEFVGSLVSDIVPVLLPRATYERTFLRVSPACGTGGYFNRWVLRIKNEHPRSDAILVVGMPIAQIQFWRVENVRGGPKYGSNKERDKYHPQEGDAVNTLRNWKMFEMLPRFDTEPEKPDADARKRSDPIPWAPPQQQIRQPQPIPPPPPPQNRQYRQPPPQPPQTTGYQQPYGHHLAQPPPGGYHQQQQQQGQYPQQNPDGTYKLPPDLQPVRVSSESFPSIPKLDYDPTPPW